MLTLPEGRDLAQRFKSVCIETSAKQRVNVDEAFVAAVRAIRQSQRATQGVAAALPAAPGVGKQGVAGGRPVERRDDEVSQGCCGGCVIL